jgi:hypothetical protein
MTELLSTAERLRKKAQAKRDNSGSQVKSETILNTVVNFLNGEMDFTTVEHIYPPKKQRSQIVTRFNSIIKENDLDELVYAIEDDNHVYLTLLVERNENDSNENENDDSDEETSGVEVEA